jgi:hypothetical protein|tara:strand:- start:2618 stop:3076 length:459 start_codon:yes stop_codon:yes gene_type:complete
MARNNVPSDVFKSIDMKGGDKNVCWPWTKTTNAKDGRPYITIKGKRRPSYVIVLECVSGTSQKEGQVARHSCDNPICCNPHHLAWGTHQDNMDDMVKRDRHGLPRTVIRAIRKLLSEGRTHSEISNLYGVSRETITAINNGRTHKGITNEED